MLSGQILPGQMSPWQLESVLDVPRNLPVKFHQNRVSNSWDIAGIEFAVLGGGLLLGQANLIRRIACSPPLDS